MDYSSPPQVPVFLQHQQNHAKSLAITHTSTLIDPHPKQPKHHSNMNSNPKPSHTDTTNPTNTSHISITYTHTIINTSADVSPTLGTILQSASTIPPRAIPITPLHYLHGVIYLPFIYESNRDDEKDGTDTVAVPSLLAGIDNNGAIDEGDGDVDNHNDNNEGTDVGTATRSTLDQILPKARFNPRLLSPFSEAVCVSEDIPTLVQFNCPVTFLAVCLNPIAPDDGDDYGRSPNQLSPNTNPHHLEHIPKHIFAHFQQHLPAIWKYELVYNVFARSSPLPLPTTKLELLWDVKFIHDNDFAATIGDVETDAIRKRLGLYWKASQERGGNS